VIKIINYAKKEYIIGTIMAGKRFATLILVIPSILKLRPMISKLPTAVILFITAVVKIP
jgi:hypothetical protein